MSDRNRRLVLGALGLGLLGLATARAGWLQGLLPARDLAFTPMETPAGYRILKAGAISFGGGVPLFGLDQERPDGLVRAQEQISGDLEAALFGGTQPATGEAPIAYFFDYQCPICRRLTPRLRALDGARISWHDLAGLGKPSEIAARAAIAARTQGAYDIFHERLMRARFQATDGYVATLAESVGINPVQLQADMASPATEEHMWLSRALAGLFGMAGTPGLVIGRSVIIGDISTRNLERILHSEKS